jgi:uncharacterized protein (DUF302 family)
MPAYTLTVHVDDDPAAAEKRVREALQEEGFGILTEIDVAATLKQKLDVDMEAYKILGACNPPLANEALGKDRHIGALLPCNVVVRANPEGGTDVIAADPAAMLEVAGPDLGSVASEARTRIERALKSLT